MVLTGLGFGATIYWDRGAGNDQWEEPNNWSGNTLPTMTDTVRAWYNVIGGTTNITIDTAGVAKVQKWQQKYGSTTLTVLSSATFETSGLG